jgi:type II secretory pathway pseudopilin PulG
MNKFLLLLFKFKKVTPRKETGFTTLEILISLIIALLFVAVSMQSLVYAMAMKVQAQEKQRANELIQEDIERINRLGSTLAVGAAAIPAVPAIGATPAVAAVPAARPFCNPVATSADASTTPATPARTAYENGYASALWRAIPAGNQTKTIIKKIKSDGSSETGGKQLALRRFEISSTANNSTAPHRTLKVGYQVWNWDGTNFLDKNNGTLGAGDEPIAETYVEIIPDVALQCP